MKKYLSLLIALFLIVSTASAIDYVGVNAGSKRGKFSKTNSPVFAEVTATTANYTYTGTITANVFVATSSATIPVATITTASITNLGAALNTQAYAITGGSAITAGLLTCTGVTNSGTTTANKVVSVTTVSGTQFTMAGIIANVTTAAVTVSTGNVNIPVTVNGTLLYIKANTAL